MEVGRDFGYVDRLDQKMDRTGLEQLTDDVVPDNMISMSEIHSSENMDVINADADTPDVEITEVENLVIPPKKVHTKKVREAHAGSGIRTSCTVISSDKIVISDDEAPSTDDMSVKELVYSIYSEGRITISMGSSPKKSGKQGKVYMLTPPANKMSDPDSDSLLSKIASQANVSMMPNPSKSLLKKPRKTGPTARVEYTVDESPLAMDVFEPDEMGTESSIPSSGALIFSCPWCKKTLKSSRQLTGHMNACKKVGDCEMSTNVVKQSNDEQKKSKPIESGSTTRFSDKEDCSTSKLTQSDRPKDYTKHGKDLLDSESGEIHAVHNKPDEDILNETPSSIDDNIGDNVFTNSVLLNENIDSQDPDEGVTRDTDIDTGDIASNGGDDDDDDDDDDYDLGEFPDDTGSEFNPEESEPEPTHEEGNDDAIWKLDGRKTRFNLRNTRNSSEKSWTQSLKSQDDDPQTDEILDVSEEQSPPMKAKRKASKRKATLPKKFVGKVIKRRKISENINSGDESDATFLTKESKSSPRFEKNKTKSVKVRKGKKKVAEESADAEKEEIEEFTPRKSVDSKKKKNNKEVKTKGKKCLSKWKKKKGDVIAKMAKTPKSSEKDMDSSPEKSLQEGRMDNNSGTECDNDTKEKSKAKPKKPRIRKRRRNNDKVYTCSRCGEQLYSYLSFISHNKTHGPERFRCTVCEKLLATKSSLKYHMLIHEGKKEHVCPFCGWQFIQQGQLENHIRSKHDVIQKNFSCPKCVISLGSKHSLQVHMEMHENKEYLDKYQMYVQNYQGMSSTSRHKISCFICRNDYSRFVLWLAHLKEHISSEEHNLTDDQITLIQTILQDNNSLLQTAKVLHCDYCQKEFASLRFLSQHKRDMHAVREDTAFVCKLCGGTFPTKKRLQGHMKRHRGHGYSCDICNDEFVSRVKLSRHQIVDHDILEDGSGQYRCPICGMLSNETELKNHILKEHEDIPFQKKFGYKQYACDVCGRFFRTTDNLKVHYRTHTNEKPYACPVCDKVFSDPANLIHHGKSHRDHPSEIFRRKKNIMFKNIEKFE